MTTDLRVAIDAAHLAGERLLKYYRTDLEVKHKDGEFDPVTQADSEADDLLRSYIGKQFPDDALLTEENPSRPDAYTGRIWMVDPLDGTKDFILGRDTFSVIVGLLVDGLPALGVVYLPAKSELYYAERGQGAYRVADGKTVLIKANAIGATADARMFMRIPTAEARKLDKPLQGLDVKERIFGGSVGSRLCAIASDQADLFVNTHHRVSKWDTLGPQIVLSEAGGAVMTLSGNSLNYVQPGDRWDEPFVAASTKALAEQAVKLIGNQSF